MMIAKISLPYKHTTFIPRSNDVETVSTWNTPGVLVGFIVSLKDLT